MKKFSFTLLIIMLITALMVPTFSALAEEQSEPITVNNNYKTTYELSTGIIGYATVSAYIDSQSELDAIKNLSGATDKAPAIAYLRVKDVDGVLKVADKDGNILNTLTDVLNNYTADKIIPAFYLTAGDTVTAMSLQTYIRDNDIQDAFVVSSDGELINSVLFVPSVLGGYSKLRLGGILEFTDCKDMEWIDINMACAAAGARVAMIDYADKTVEQLHALYDDQKLGVPMTVFIKVDTKKEMQNAVLDGAWGVAVNDWVDTINFIESFDKTTVVRPMQIIAHRGMDVVYQENTIEGILEAARVKVSRIEVDPRLTKDKQIVLMHDADVYRITGFSGNVKDYTLAQLKAMEITVNSDAKVGRICTLEEVFIAYKKYGLTTPIVLDSKETNIEYFQILYDLMDKYDAWDIISGMIGIADSSHAAYVRELFSDKYPWLHKIISGTTVDVKDTVLNTIENWMIVLANGLNGTGARGNVSPYFDQIVKSAGESDAMPEVVRAANDRAIKVTPYQFDTVPVMEEAFLLGLADYSTGWSEYFREFPEYLNVENTNLTAKVGESIVIDAKTVTGPKVETAVNPITYQVFDGDGEVLKVEDGKINAVKEGTVTIRSYITYKNGNIEYRVYSDEITVTVAGKVAPPATTTATADDGGCGSSINAVGFTPVLAVLGIVFIVIKKKRSSLN